jgi:hypothetical protein
MAYDRIIGAVATEDGAYLVKHFSVPQGTTVTGVTFVSNDLATTFPRVTVLQGRAARLSDAAVLAEARNVRSTGSHHIIVNFSPVTLRAAAEIYVAIALPSNDGVLSRGHGAGIAAMEAEQPRDSYFVTTRAGYLGRMDVEYAIELLHEGASKASADRGNPIETGLGSTAVRVSPNPTGRSSGIEFTVPNRAHVQLLVYDIAGRLVREFDRGELSPGIYRHEWDGIDARNERVSAGIYVMRVRIGDVVLTRKLVRLE